MIDYRKTVEPSERLFPSSESESGHFGSKQAHNILAGVFKQLELEGAKTYSMRRKLLTTLSHAGVPLRTVQGISGHASFSQLQAYLEVDPEDKHKSLNLVKY